MLEELELLVSNSFCMFMSEIITFKCSGCNTRVTVVKKAVERNGAALCLTCGMPHTAETVDDGFNFRPGEPPFKCCCGVSFVASKQIKIGNRFACHASKWTFVIVGAEAEGRWLESSRAYQHYRFVHHTFRIQPTLQRLPYVIMKP